MSSFSNLTVMSSDIPLTPPPSSQKQGRKGIGRRKIPIERIDHNEYRRVTFTKRKKGIFKKAKELSILCGAEIAVITFSEAGKPFTYGYPSVGEVVDRFLGDNDKPNSVDGNNEKELLISSSDDAKNKTQLPNSIVSWLVTPINTLGLNELDEMQRKLEELRDKVDKEIDRRWLSL